MSTQSLIPSFEDKKLHSIDQVANKQFIDLSNEIQVIRSIANPDTCEAKYLPFLAYAFKVDFWDENLPNDEKRALIKQSLALHRHKGTVWAIEKVFEALNIKADVSEWFTYDGEPYHFKVSLSVENKLVSTESVVDLERYINIFKNARSVLDEIDVVATNVGTLNIQIEAVAEVTAVAPYGG